MDNLNLNTLELVSTERKVPFNGAPSSQDYNDSQQECLADLAAIASFINDTVLPLINPLSATALSGLAPVGMEGRTLVADSSDVSTLFFNSLTQAPTTVADALRLLNQMLSSFNQKLTDMEVEVGSLQQRLSGSSQDDLALAIQNISNTIATVQGQQAVYSSQVITTLGLVQGLQRYRTITPVIGAGAIETVTVTWSVPFGTNTYIVQNSMEDDSGYLEVVSFSYVPDGSSILVRVHNTDTGGSHQGYVHTTAFNPVA